MLSGVQKQHFAHKMCFEISGHVAIVIGGVLHELFHSRLES